jgi:uncharacterized peroxidase-related enzyme
MPFITLPALAGILSLFAFSPETARPMRELAEVLLQRESSLTRGERELIAAYVSKLNRCTFCMSSHAAACIAHYEGDTDFVSTVLANPEAAPISEKLKALLNIAAKVQLLGSAVSQADIDRARNAGATDKEIHDTVLIAAAFCMYNRYVDGLATVAPTDPEIYAKMGQSMAQNGYIREK